MASAGGLVGIEGASRVCREVSEEDGGIGRTWAGSIGRLGISDHTNSAPHQLLPPKPPPVVPNCPISHKLFLDPILLAFTGVRSLTELSWDQGMGKRLQEAGGGLARSCKLVALWGWGG